MISSATYREEYLNKTRKKKKYHNQSKIYTTSLYGTRTFDSKLEAHYCEELDWQLKAKEIEYYDLQFKIDITINSMHWRNYYIDFRVELPDGTIRYVEVKGFATEVWKMKWDALLLQRDELLEPGHELLVVKA